MYDGAVDHRLGQFRSDAIAYLLSGVLYCAECAKDSDCHRNWLEYRWILIGIVLAVPFFVSLCSETMRGLTESVRLLFEGHLLEFFTAKHEQISPTALSACGVL